MTRWRCLGERRECKTRDCIRATRAFLRDALTGECHTNGTNGGYADALAHPAHPSAPLSPSNGTHSSSLSAQLFPFDAALDWPKQVLACRSTATIRPLLLPFAVTCQPTPPPPSSSPFGAALDWPAQIVTAAGPVQMDTYHRWMEVVVPASLAGLPALSVPVGFGPPPPAPSAPPPSCGGGGGGGGGGPAAAAGTSTSSSSTGHPGPRPPAVAPPPAGGAGGGLPMGMQLIGRSGGDAALLQLGQAYHAATDWPARRPPPRRPPLPAPPSSSTSPPPLGAPRTCTDTRAV
jgi:hypothetical protein